MANSAAALMNKLAQFSNGAVYDDDRNVHAIHAEKLDKLAEIIEAANGNSVLVFYQFQHDVFRITEKLKGLKVRQYQDAGDLKQWNAGNIDVLLAHPASTAFGLNMQQGGHYIVWYGTGWNLNYTSRQTPAFTGKASSTPYRCTSYYAKAQWTKGPVMR